MKQLVAVAVVLGSSVASAGPAKPVVLVVNPAGVRFEGDKLGHMSISAVRVIAPTPTVSGTINAQIAGFSQLLGAAERWGKQRAQGTTEVICETSIATDRFVSWRCKARYFFGIGAGHVATGNVRIDGDTMSEVTLKTLFDTNLGKVLALESEPSSGGYACKLEAEGSLFVEETSITTYGTSDMTGCTISWEKLEPLLPAKSAWMKELRAGIAFDFDKRHEIEGPRDFTAAWSKAPQRFVADADGVRDRVTGLVWAAADNGKDVTWDEAAAFAKAYRGGGKTDWRLPTEEELEVFAQPETAHREKGDCTGGTAQLLSTPLVKLSCGLAWSSTKVDDKRAVGFGFLSGNPRVSSLTEKKNYRALVVRK